MGRTHVLLGINTIWTLQVPWPGFSLGADAFAGCILAAAFGALLPDLDAPTSLLQNVSVAGVRPFKVVALGAAPYGHRGPLHSRIGLAVVAVLASPLLIYVPLLWLALLLGFASHLAADACTRGGIRWRYPDARKTYLLPKRLRFVTGSPPEDGVFVLAAIGCLLLVLRQLSAGLH